jgi:hypothetical protein
MTHCTGAPAELWLERYIQGTLPDAECQQFEEHYFDCPVCLAQVEALQAVRARLAELPASEAAVQQPPLNQPATKKRAPLISWPTAAASIVALAASLLIVFLSYHFLLPNFLPPTVVIETGPQTPATSQPPANSRTPPSQSSSSLIQLADLTLPPFRSATLRGESENADFVSGMKAYAAGNCRAALTALDRISAAGRDALEAEFYSGVCQMHLGNLPAAAATLQRVTVAGDSPQQEAAFYYLAQIALARNDRPSARQALERTLALHGDFEQRARRQSAALAAAARKQ